MVIKVWNEVDVVGNKERINLREYFKEELIGFYGGFNVGDI